MTGPSHNNAAVYNQAFCLPCTLPVERAENTMQNQKQQSTVSDCQLTSTYLLWWIHFTYMQYLTTARSILIG